MIWPARRVCCPRRVQGRADLGQVGIGLVEQPHAALHIVGGGRQRLVQFVRQGRGHFAQRGQPRDMGQFILQVVQPPLGLLAFADVAHEAGEEPLVTRAHLADRQFHGEGRAVAAFAHHHAADADDPPLTGVQVALQIAVVAVAVGPRHQLADVAPDHLFRRPAEQALGRGAERPDGPGLVDHHHGAGHGRQDRSQVGLADRQFGVRPLALLGAAAVVAASQARRQPKDGEHRRGHGIGGLGIEPRPDQQERAQERERGRGERRAHPAHRRAPQQRRHEDDQQAGVLRDGDQQGAEGQAHGRGRHGEGIGAERPHPGKQAV